MIFDLHVHPGAGKFSAEALQRKSLRRMGRRLGFDTENSGREANFRIIEGEVLRLLEESVIDRAVFLALDAAFREDGIRDDARTLMVMDNDEIADLAAVNVRVLFGAGIHPYRPDALRELERLVNRGACLIKWLPSAQNIKPDDPRCFPFYEALAHFGIPLLCHTGNEHTLSVFPNDFNDPGRLRPALEMGVTVIAAHCGLRLYLHEKSYFHRWRGMTRRHENLYGDISAFGIITRIWTLRSMLKSPGLRERLVFGSDFPVAPMPWTCLGCLGLRAVRYIQGMKNPFDRSVALMKGVGVPDEVFARGGSLLRLGKNEKSRNRSAVEETRG